MRTAIIIFFAIIAVVFASMGLRRITDLHDSGLGWYFIAGSVVPIFLAVLLYEIGRINDFLDYFKTEHEKQRVEDYVKNGGK